MSDGIHRQSGRGPSEKHFPIYQGVLAVRCHQCSKVHKMMFTSDERDMIENQVEHMLRVLREGGYTPAAIITESYHPGTDLTIREWQAVEEMFDATAASEPF